MLTSCVFVTTSITLFYLELLSIIQCELVTKNTGLLKYKHQGIMQTTMLDTLVIHNSLVYDVYIDDIVDTKFHIRHLLLFQYFV